MDHDVVLRKLLERNKFHDSVNALGGRYGIALQAGSRGGYEKVVRMLLQKGADVNAPAASFGGQEKVVRVLLREGARSWWR
jgi:hypothetical protein